MVKGLEWATPGFKRKCFNLRNLRRRKNAEKAEVELRKSAYQNAYKKAAETSRGLRDEKSSGAMQVDEEQNDYKKAHCEGSHGEGEYEDDEEDDNEDTFINHISALSRLKTMRKRWFPWTDSLERSLSTSYARYKASLGAQFHCVGWNAIPGLPAPLEICRRRISSFKHELTVRKALMNLCTLLVTRYAKHLQQHEREHKHRSKRKEMIQMQTYHSIY